MAFSRFSGFSCANLIYYLGFNALMLYWHHCHRRTKRSTSALMLFLLLLGFVFVLFRRLTLIKIDISASFKLSDCRRLKTFLLTLRSKLLTAQTFERAKGNCRFSSSKSMPKFYCCD